MLNVLAIEFSIVGLFDDESHYSVLDALDIADVSYTQFKIEIKR